jgi:hypothetical protein
LLGAQTGQFAFGSPHPIAILFRQPLDVCQLTFQAGEPFGHAGDGRKRRGRFVIEPRCVRRLTALEHSRLNLAKLPFELGNPLFRGSLSLCASRRSNRKSEDGKTG